MLGLFIAVGVALFLIVGYTLAFRADRQNRARRDARRKAAEAPDVLSARDRKSLPPDLADAAPWISYPLAEEDWALFEAAGWRTAEHRAAFERAQAQVDARAWWWEDAKDGSWSWWCTCGGGSGHGFPDENTAMLSAQAHLTRDHRR